MEFKSFGETHKLSKLYCTVTQKIHGTNAQVLVYALPDGTLDLKVGCRTRWIYPDEDNFGFAAFVYLHKQEFIEKLGVGQHFGEWAGPGINSGEGLTSKTFVLFDWWRFPDETPLPPSTITVPVLYQGPYSSEKINEVLEDLKTNGSRLAPGFMRPEGIVVNINGVRYKQVFMEEETAWKKPHGVKKPKADPSIDYSHLCQPVRLEKLLSRDEQLPKNYPASLPQIVKDYVTDLIKEGQITGDEDAVKATTKGASGQIFKFIKHSMETLK